MLEALPTREVDAPRTHRGIADSVKNFIKNLLKGR
jgi:hypothetical protein